MHKYLSPKKYLNRLLLLSNSRVFPFIESFIAPKANMPLRHPPIFFLGAPRSGSTLAIQVITDVLDVGYLSNRHAQFYGAPGIAEKIFHPTRCRQSSDYRSNYGVTEGWHAPAEAGLWWYRFFRRFPAYVRIDEVKEKKMIAFRRSVASLTNAFDRPVFFKNLYASLRIQAISHYFPESLFIVMHRNEVENGHSLLEARFKAFSNYNTWWSMEPPEVKKLKRFQPHEQVIEQIRHIHATIENDLLLANVESFRRYDLRYEEFCSDPKAEITKIKDFLGRNRCSVNYKSTPPSHFDCRKIVRIDESLHKAMQNYAKSS